MPSTGGAGRSAVAKSYTVARLSRPLHRFAVPLPTGVERKGASPPHGMGRWPGAQRPDGGASPRRTLSRPLTSDATNVVNALLMKRMREV